MQRLGCKLAAHVHHSSTEETIASICYFHHLYKKVGNVDSKKMKRGGNSGVNFVSLTTGAAFGTEAQSGALLGMSISQVEALAEEDTH